MPTQDDEMFDDVRVIEEYRCVPGSRAVAVWRWCGGVYRAASH